MKWNIVENPPYYPPANEPRTVVHNVHANRGLASEAVKSFSHSQHLPFAIFESAVHKGVRGAVTVHTAENRRARHSRRMTFARHVHGSHHLVRDKPSHQIHANSFRIPSAPRSHRRSAASNRMNIGKSEAYVCLISGRLHGTRLNI